MRKKMICSLFLVVTLLLTSLPVFALWTFDISDVNFYSVSNDYETPASKVSNGTMRAEVKFSNTTNEDYFISLYLCAKDVETGRIKAVNMQNYNIPTSLAPMSCKIDVKVENSKKEDLFLYIWDKNNSPLCEPIFLEHSETFEDSFTMEAFVENTYRANPLLIKSDGTKRVALTLLKQPSAEVFEELKKYEEFNYEGDKAYLDDPIYVSEGDTLAYKYIGCNVIVELGSSESGALEIKSIVPDSSKTDILTVSKDIEIAEATEYGAIFEYWNDINNDTKTTKINIAYNAEVHVNGELIGTLKKADAVAAFESLTDSNFEGTVQFAGHKNDDFTVIFITEYNYHMVESVDIEYEAIELTNGYIELGTESRDKGFFYNIYKNGEKISLADIQKDDVLAFVCPDGDMDSAPFIDIYVSSDKVEGTVTAYSLYGNTCYINGSVYDICNNTRVKVGDEGIFYLTHDGKIYDSKTSGINLGDYGFIAKVGATESFGENRYQMRLITHEDNIETYNVAEKLKVTAEIDGEIDTITLKASNGDQDKLFEDIHDIIAGATDETTAQAKAAYRLIRYTLSDAGEINSITFASPLGNDGEDFNLKTVSGYYKPDTGRFGSYYFGEETLILYAPVSKLDYDYYEDYNYGIDINDVKFISRDMLDEYLSYDAFAYATDNKVMGATMIVSEMGFTGKNKPLAVVTGVATGLNADNEKATLITLFQSGSAKIYYVGDEAYALYDICVGDIIQYIADEKNHEIIQAEIVFDGDLTDYADYVNYDESDIEFVSGYVVDHYNGAVTIDDDFEDEMGVEYTFYTNDKSTLAMVKEALAGTSGYVTRVASPEAFKYTNTMSSRHTVYYMVARLIDGEIVDAVEYNLGEIQ